MKFNVKKTISILAFLLGLSFTLPAFAGTGVYVNGQELSRAQLVTATFMTGGVPQRGHYWYNPMTGAYGRVGEYSSYNGGNGSGSGDNFWSGRYGAGNSNADNSQGYVSLPGGGSVTYGM